MEPLTRQERSYMTVRPLLSRILLMTLWSVTACAGEMSPDDGDKTSRAVAQAAASATRFPDDPAAHALFDQMMRALYAADSLSFVSHYRCTGKTDYATEGTNCTYRIWLKKPNYFRLEALSASGKESGTLIGDGNTLWTFWPQGRPKHPWEEAGAYEKTRSTSYRKTPAPMGGHSISHETATLGVGLVCLVVDLSTFHDGLGDGGLEPYLDGVTSLGTMAIDGEECDQIEVSFMSHQRVWSLSVAKRDHLPRLLKYLVRMDSDTLIEEQWSSVTINAPIPETMFSWKPPADWTEWKEPPQEAGLLQPGTPAPDFELASAAGTPIRLADYRGKVVWLCLWKVGCPPCRKELPYLQDLYLRYHDKGLVVLGFNGVDDRQLALELLQEKGISFPQVLDTSEGAQRVAFEELQKPGQFMVPLNYILDPEGRIVEGWYGYSDKGGWCPGPRILEKTGGELGLALRRDWEAAAQRDAPAVLEAARDLFAALRRADYRTDWIGTQTWKEFPSKLASYEANRDMRGWVRWVCQRFQEAPISDVRLGEVSAGSGGMPTVPYQLYLHNGEIIQGDLPFRWDSEQKRWLGYDGLDWHIRKGP